MEPHADTFRAVALDWIEASRHQWSTTHAAKILQRLERDAFPAIGATPLRDIDAEALRATVAAIEARGASDLSRRVVQMAAQVFRHGIATGRCDQDPTRHLTRGRGAQPAARHAHVSTEDFPALLLAIARYDRTGERTTGLALQLLAHTLSPVTDMLGATWDEFDIPAALWTIPASRAVSHQAHRVPLAPEVLAILAELRDLSIGSPFVVAGRLGAPLVHNTLLFALRRIGYGGRMTLTGFRTIAGTLLAADGFPADLVALQMAKHPRKAEPGSVDPSARLAERVEMMRRWSAKVSSLTRQAHAAERAQAIP